MKSLKHKRKRSGRCYELAWVVMLYEPGAERFTLVHGRLTKGTLAQKGNYYHAWIDLNDGRVYDATTNKYFSAAEYESRWGAVADHRYSKIEAAQLSSGTHNYGRWTAEEERTYLKDRRADPHAEVAALCHSTHGRAS